MLLKFPQTEEKLSYAYHIMSREGRVLPSLPHHHPIIYIKYPTLDM